MSEESYQNIGKNIKKRMKELGLKQGDLADKLGFTRQTIGSWVKEDNPAIPDSTQLPKIAEALGTTVGWLYNGVTTPDWLIREKMFDEEHMFTRLKTIAIQEHLSQFFEALSYAKEKHAGVYRDPNLYLGREAKEKVPYILHPLMMACHAHALGIRDDEVLTSIMLHDVCEDCDVKPEELPFSENVQKIVALLTKNQAHKHDPGYDDKYYAAIKLNPKAAIVKALDRCNNVSTMAGSFEPDKLAAYIKETEKYGYDLFDYIKEHYLEYNDAIYVIKYQVMSTIETIKCLQKSTAVPMFVNEKN